MGLSWPAFMDSQLSWIWIPLGQRARPDGGCPQWRILAGRFAHRVPIGEPADSNRDT